MRLRGPLHAPPNRHQRLPQMQITRRGDGDADVVLRRLDRQVELVRKADPDPGVDLYPVPERARRGELRRSLEAIRDSADAHRRLNEVDRAERDVPLVPDLALPTLALQSGEVLLRELERGGRAVQLGVEPTAVLLFLVILDRQAEPARA